MVHHYLAEFRMKTDTQKFSPISFPVLDIITKLYVAQPQISKQKSLQIRLLYEYTTEDFMTREDTYLFDEYF